MNMNILRIFNIITMIILIVPILFYTYGFVIENISKTFESATICKGSLNSGQKFWCYYELELHINKPGFCEKWFTEEYRKTCYYRTAMRQSDESLCNRSNYVDICHGVFEKKRSK